MIGGILMAASKKKTTKKTAVKKVATAPKKVSTTERDEKITKLLIVALVLALTAYLALKHYFKVI